MDQTLSGIRESTGPFPESGAPIQREVFYRLALRYLPQLIVCSF